MPSKYHFPKESIDPLILPAVEILNKHGFETFESCQGGENHCFPEPTVRFYGDEFDLVRAFEICECHNIAVLAAKRVFRKTDFYKDNKLRAGFIWDKPFNEITFVIHSNTGTIFLPD
jgi:hypothetical protein